MRLAAALFLAGLAFARAALADPLIAPTVKLRAAFLQGNPAQGTVNPATSESRGVVVDLTNEMGRRIKVPVQMMAVAGVPAVIEAVGEMCADIGFVACDPSRAGTIEFSQTYMLVKQTFPVLKDSAMRSVEELDRPGLKIGAGCGYSIPLPIRYNFERATIIVPKSNPTALMAVDRLIDEARASEFLKAAIERAGVIGVEVAPSTDR
jgi:polar amino acid transport system substrate-binding protein